MNISCNDYGFYAPIIYISTEVLAESVFSDVKEEKHGNSITFQCIHVFDTDSGPDYKFISCYLFPGDMSLFPSDICLVFFKEFVQY